MKKTSWLLAGVATVALYAISMQASAAIIDYSVTLNGATEEPATASSGVGSGLVRFDTTANTMRVQVIYFGLTSAVTAAHIHCCTANTLTGNAGVATQTPTFTGFPTTTYGSYDQTFDMTLAGSYNPSFITANGGTPLSAFAALTAGAANLRDYLNIHTANNGGGEIRGFLKPLVAPVPLPAAAWLLLSGFSALTMFSRRRRAATA
jgi:hypothetical protein